MVAEYAYSMSYTNKLPKVNTNEKQPEFTNNGAKEQKDEQTRKTDGREIMSVHIILKGGEISQMSIKCTALIINNVNPLRRL